jgi:hypothetical protein
MADLFGEPQTRGHQAAERLDNRFFVTHEGSPWGACERLGAAV